jgi:uncharacterized membrane protein
VAARNPGGDFDIIHTRKTDMNKLLAALIAAAFATTGAFAADAKKEAAAPAATASAPAKKDAAAPAKKEAAAPAAAATASAPAKK